MNCYVIKHVKDGCYLNKATTPTNAVHTKKNPKVFTSAKACCRWIEKIAFLHNNFNYVVVEFDDESLSKHHLIENFLATYATKKFFDFSGTELDVGDFVIACQSNKLFKGTVTKFVGNWMTIESVDNVEYRLSSQEVAEMVSYDS